MNTLYKILFGLVLASLLPSNGSPLLTGRRPGQGDSLETKYVWTQLTAKADFPKSYNFQLFANDTNLWAFHSAGVWSSTDGRIWQKRSLINIVKNQAFLDYVEFNGFIYALGTFEGNIERYVQTTQIARTSDFKSWEILSKDSNLPKRYFYHPFVFQNKIWIVGGEDATGKYSDAWVSSDAVHWMKVTDNLPFGKRAGQHFVIF
ncbi:MAG: hypothetical protein HY277_04145, partial [Ignavibacteriales bacterium]|nr:hypothetical protein [Ignavibacteriales bacterium]